MKSSSRNLLYLLSFTPAIAVVYGNFHGGIFTLLNVMYSLGVLAVLEWIIPSVNANDHSAKEDQMPHLIALLHLPVQVIALTSLFVGIYLQIISGYWMIAAALSTGLNSGSSALVVAHELIHRKNKFEQWMGRALLFTAGNMYFFVTHLRVHHKWVGTAKDHSTANKGEGLYAFFIRSVRSQFMGAYQLEQARINEGHQRFFMFNYVLRQVELQLLLLLILAMVLGFVGVIAYLIQCVFANFLLEYINYVQHYGLTRNEKERVTEFHSWDCNRVVSRFVLVDLARHADHHYYASKPYHTLQTFDHGPKLPTGYAGLFIIAAIPPWWRKVMDPLLPA